MSKVEIYTLPHCRYCDDAKRLLDEMKIRYEPINLRDDPVGLAAFGTRTGGARSVPQIFINNIHIGGFSELLEMKLAGELDMLTEDNSSGAELATQTTTGSEGTEG